MALTMRNLLWLLCLCTAHVWCQSTTSSASTPPSVSTPTPAPPSNVAQVNVLNRSETHLELQWDKVNNNSNYDYILRYSNGTESTITGSDAGTMVTHTVLSLSPGTNYSFTLYTVFKGVNSTGFQFSEVTTPSNVAKVNVVNRSETHLELEWDKVNNNSNYDYILRYSNGPETTITGSDAGTTVNHTVSSLSPGTKYSFTLYTVFEGVNSTGLLFSEVTTPSNVAKVNVVTRSENHLELQWTKVNNNNNYDYILRYSNGAETSITGSDAGTTVNHTVSSLSPGTKHSFTLFTVFEGVNSTGLLFSEVTTPSNVAQVNVVNRSETHLELQWTKVNNNSNYDYILRDSNGAETTITGSDAGTSVTHTVSSLSPGTNYSFTLYTVFEGVNSTGFQFSVITTPSNVAQVNVVNRSENHLELEWDKVNNNNNYDYILRDSNETETTITGSDAGTSVNHTVSSLSPGTKYSFTLYTVFEGVRSTGFQFSNVTTPSNVAQVNVVTRSENHLELQWTKVNNNNNYDYILRYSNGPETTITGSDAGNTVTHTVSSLSPDTKYSFTLFTVFKKALSQGFTFSVSTVHTAAKVTVTKRTETELTLEWRTASNTDYILMDGSGTNTTFSHPLGEKVTYTVSSLSPGTKYDFTLLTIFENRTNKYEFTSVTTINCTAEQWTTTSSTIEGQVQGLFSMAIATNGSDVDAVNGTVELNKVSFSNLCPGAKYIVSLYYEIDLEKLLQCSHSLNLVPAAVTSVSCNSEDFSIGLKWEKPFGVWTEVEVSVGGKDSYLVTETELKVTGLQPAQTYSFSVTSLSGTIKSSPVEQTCHTGSMVIWLPVAVITLLVLLTAVGVFVYRKKRNPSEEHHASINLDEKHKKDNINLTDRHSSSQSS